ncbi:MAG: hypothetical protein LBG96_05825, partial [Tannerella sp.]|nr:hypothetical protein [Tannerella sp.]
MTIRLSSDAASLGKSADIIADTTDIPSAPAFITSAAFFIYFTYGNARMPGYLTDFTNSLTRAKSRSRKFMSIIIPFYLQLFCKYLRFRQEFTYFYAPQKNKVLRDK